MSDAHVVGSSRVQMLSFMDINWPSMDDLGVPRQSARSNEYIGLVYLVLVAGLHPSPALNNRGAKV